ncbi:MAG: DpnI domain-containing protein, partial [Thermoplasmata archaeon]
ELKARHGPFLRQVPDGAYRTFQDAILHDRAPNLLLLEYDRLHWRVETLRAIPRGVVSRCSVRPRPPLSERARRRGWQGCSIDLTRIPPDAVVPVVEHRRPLPWEEVRWRWDRYEFLVPLRPRRRAWYHDVLALVAEIGAREFAPNAIYAHERELARLHPENRNIRPKIRQQLQCLVAAGVLDRLAPGRYRLRAPVPPSGDGTDEGGPTGGSAGGSPSPDRRRGAGAWPGA